MELRFEWDSNKSTTNLAKHGVSFDEARQVFDDRTIGLGLNGQLVVVFYTDRGDTIRVIGARRATRREQYVYEEEPV